MSLHTPTIFVLCALIGVLIAAATLIGERQGIRHNGTGLVAVGLLLMAASFLLFGVDRLLPRWIVVVFGNTTLAASAYAFLRAFEQLYGLPSTGLARVSLAGLLLMALLNAGLFATSGDTALRSGLSGVLAGVLFALPGVLLLRHFEAWQGRLHRVMAGALFFSAAFMFANGAWDLFFATDATYRRQSNPVDVYLAPALVAAEILGSFGFLLMLRERDLLKQALLDGLTGVMNRRAMLGAMAGALAFAQRSGAACSLLLLDLDHFKRINDTHGHAAGDEVLKRFASLVGGLLRREDVLGRYGGEEFAVLLCGHPAQAAMDFAARIRAALAVQPLLPAKADLRVSVSIGVVERRPGGDSDVVRVLEQADQALYAAKAQGRDRAVLFDGAARPEV